MIIRKATSEDSRDLWVWRNDPQTRAMSINVDRISWADHQEWFSAMLRKPRYFFYIAVDPGGKKIGLCRFDLEPGLTAAEVRLNLNPKMRERRLSSPFLAAAIDEFRKKYADVEIKATIRRQNVSSLRCFARCQFDIVDEDEQFRYLVERSAGGSPPKTGKVRAPRAGKSALAARKRK